jgi:ankyrin repeat protein
MKDRKLIRILFSLFLVLQIPLIGYAGEEELNNSLILEAKAGNAEMVQYYVNQGADVNAKAPNHIFRDKMTGPGCTALYLAANQGHAEVVKVLLEAGAKMNIGEPFGDETPLGAAIRKGHAEVVQILKEAGAKE